jgi:hypothetical protein
MIKIVLFVNSIVKKISLHLFFDDVADGVERGCREFFIDLAVSLQPEGVCTDEFLSRKPGFLLSAMHSHAFS